MDERRKRDESSKRFNRIVNRTARRLAKELDRMEEELGDEWWLSTSFECVLIDLKRLRPGRIRALMLGMSDFLAEMQRRAEPEMPTQTPDGVTLH